MKDLLVYFQVMCSTAEWFIESEILQLGDSHVSESCHDKPVDDELMLNVLRCQLTY